MSVLCAVADLGRLSETLDADHMIQPSICRDFSFWAGASITCSVFAPQFKQSAESGPKVRPSAGRASHGTGIHHLVSRNFQRVSSAFDISVCPSFAGLLALADWTGSDSAVFPFVAGFDADYCPKALQIAQVRLAVIGPDIPPPHHH